MLTNQNDAIDFDITQYSNYNIYIALPPSKNFIYLYTDLFKSSNEAITQAFEELKYYYEFFENKPTLQKCYELAQLEFQGFTVKAKHFSDEIHNLYLNKYKNSNLENPIKALAEDIYGLYLGLYGKYYAIPTEIDTIPEKDLILNYVFCDN